uniref:Uncharacterized protein n=1 Tax=Sciurus vulgaris TaxID=55149 RepID=A0A8D2AP15_SCIVU
SDNYRLSFGAGTAVTVRASK